ncbi:Gibberellin-regulated protein 12 [Acorus gramineus]|uniref:Gibberellin-regulated protein 12 n=1 Tax=Acorus gramineus TaxID=55184 RepID=A0AAV9A5S4_ACOGR|nr:Gibberellin-regulated protein 12 [Acorus gramineus]
MSLEEEGEKPLGLGGAEEGGGAAGERTGGGLRWVRRGGQGIRRFGGSGGLGGLGEGEGSSTGEGPKGGMEEVETVAGMCHCVPSGTYGHKEECPCYNNMKTKEGKPKYP